MIAPRRRHAFTLLELILVIAIIASLAALLVPVISLVRARADATVCQSNLRQIGVSAQLYAGEHDQTMPTIEPWPSTPTFGANDGAQSLLAALQPYGVTATTLTCRTDVAGPNYRAKEGASYEWCPMANGQKLQAVRLIWPGNFDIPLSKLITAFDYSAVHTHRSHVLFGDGHVAASE